MKGQLFLQSLAFLSGAVFVVLSIALAPPPTPLHLGLAALGVGAALLALANAPGYVTRNPCGAWKFERTSFCWSCVFLGIPLVALFMIALLCQQ
ncbi:MAG TPA: hypothetical protein VEL76_17810 [Gemmataceae bacterium]|nr:hypothetical protein [Gemmataceae bacterium]